MMTTLTPFPANIDGEWLADDHGGYPATVTDFWNGWAVAVVTRPVMERMVADLRDLHADEPDHYPNAHWDGDTVVVDSSTLDWLDEADRNDPDVYLDRYAPIPSGPFAGQYSALGAMEWCWHVAHPAERIDQVATVFRNIGIPAEVERRPLDGSYRLTIASRHPAGVFTVTEEDGRLTVRFGDDARVADFDGGWYPQPSTADGAPVPNFIAAWVFEELGGFLR